MNENDTVSARATRHINASPEPVYESWITPQRIKAWMFPEETDEIVSIDVDPVAGGSFSFIVRRDNDEIEHLGENLELSSPNRLAFTWAVADEEGADRVVVNIVETDDAPDKGSEVTVTHELHPDWVHYVDLSRKAWETMLAALAADLERQRQ